MKKTIAILLFFSVVTVHAQSAMNAVKAFAKLEARTEMGISYQDYTVALGDVNFEFKEFLNGKDSKKYPGITRAIGAALGRYAEAGMV